MSNATSSKIIDKIRKLHTKMAAKEVAMVVILSELADSDDEKPTRGPPRSRMRRRKENGFFETIISCVNGFLTVFPFPSCSIPHHWRDYLQCPPYSKISLFFIQFLKQKHSNYDVKRSNRDSIDCFFFTSLMK